MSQVTLQPDRENGRVWVTLDGQRLVALRSDDYEGLKAITTWLVDSRVISVEEAAVVQGVTPRTVEAYQAIYVTTGNSAELASGLLRHVKDLPRSYGGKPGWRQASDSSASVKKCA